METPVLRKVRGKTAEVLRKESWPGPEKRKELEKRKRNEEFVEEAAKDAGAVGMQAEKPS